MTIQTITIEYAGPSKRNPKFGSVLDTAKVWYDAPLAVAEQLKAQKGKAVAVDAEKNARGFWQIKAIAPPQVQAAAQAAATAGQINREEGMFAMAVVGKVFQGTGTVPDRNVVSSLIVNAVMAWRDAEDDLARIAEQNDMGDLGGDAPPPDGAPPF